MKIRFATIGLSCLLSFPALGNEPPVLVGQPLNICGDGAGWPPYHFEKDGTFYGYDLDVLHAILDPLNIKFTFSMPPWKRCQVGTAAGDYNLAVSASYSLERDTTYIMTEYYYNVTPSVVTTEGFIQGKQEVSLEELKSWRVCGLHGYNYSYVDVRTLNMVYRGPDYAQTIQKLDGKPCDVMLARKEAVLGFNKNVGVKILNETHRIPYIKGAKIDPFYMLISRKYTQADQLKTILNTGFKRLRKSGELDQILKKYL